MFGETPAVFMARSSAGMARRSPRWIRSRIRLAVARLFTPCSDLSTVLAAFFDFGFFKRAAADEARPHDPLNAGTVRAAGRGGLRGLGKLGDGIYRFDDKTLKDEAA